MPNRASYFNTVLTHEVGSVVVNIMPNAEITLYEAGTNDPLAETIYKENTGLDTWTNPFEADDDGSFSFFLTQAKPVKVVATKPGEGTVTYDFQPVVSPPGELTGTWEGNELNLDGAFTARGVPSGTPGFGGIKIYDDSNVGLEDGAGTVAFGEAGLNPNHDVSIFETVYDNVTELRSPGRVARNSGNRIPFFVGMYDRTIGKDIATSYFQYYQDEGFSAGRAIIAAAVRLANADIPHYTTANADITLSSYTEGDGLRTMEVGGATMVSIDDPNAIDQNCIFYTQAQLFGQGPFGAGGRPHNTGWTVGGMDNMFNMWFWTGAASYPKGINEIQTITITPGTTGNIVLNDGTGTCAPFAANTSSAATVQTAIEAASTIGASNVSVSGSQYNWVVAFQNARAGQNMGQLVWDATSTNTGGASNVATATTQAGSSYGYANKYVSVSEGGTSVTPEGDRTVPLSVNRYPGLIGHGLYNPTAPFHASAIDNVTTWTRPVTFSGYTGMFVGDWTVADNHARHFVARSKGTPARQAAMGYSDGNQIGVLQVWATYPSVAGNWTMQPFGGKVGIGTGSISAALHVLPELANVSGILVQQRTSQTANLFELANADNSALLAKFDADAKLALTTQITIGSLTNGTSKLDIKQAADNGGTANGWRVYQAASNSFLGAGYLDTAGDFYFQHVSTGATTTRYLRFIAGEDRIFTPNAFDSNTEFRVQNVKVVGVRGAAVADATGAGDVVAQLNALLARIRAHGLIAP